MTPRNNRPRESIWSLRQEDRTKFSFYFSILFIIGMSWVAWYQIGYVVHDSIADTINAVVMGIAQVGVSAATITFFRFEGADAMGVALDLWRERRKRERDEMIAKAVEEATAKTRAENEALKKRIAELEKSNGDAS